jgi:hypothetical protein
MDGDLLQKAGIKRKFLFSGFLGWADIGEVICIVERFAINSERVLQPYSTLQRMTSIKSARGADFASRI